MYVENDAVIFSGYDDGGKFDFNYYMCDDYSTQMD